METHPDTWRRGSFRAMGSTITVWLDVDGDGDGAFEEVERLFSDNEARLSRFRPDSELAQLNRGDGWQPVSDLLWEMAVCARALAQETGGRFDPTMLPALLAAGYDADFAALGGRAAPPAGAVPLTGRWRALRLDADRRAIRLPEGGGLDLGGLAKGMTAAQAIRRLAVRGPALVDAGGDLVAGAPPRGYPGWPVAVGAPGEDPADDVATLWLADAALATSGRDFRRWQTAGGEAHHIIDPRTGRSAATDLLTATVLARDAATAEAWATALLVDGLRQGLSRLHRRRLPALLITNDGRVVATPAMRRRLQSMERAVT